MNCQTHHYRGQDPTNITRRWFFRDCGVGLGSIALARASGPRRPRRVPGAGRRPAGAQEAAAAGQGQARHLPVHGRGAEPSGAVRLQAAAGQVRRHAAAAGTAQGLSRRVHQSQLEAAGSASSSSPSTARCGAELSELLPHLATVVDDIAIVKSMVTDAFNHAPAQILMNTGSQQFGRPSMGAWATYGLGSESQRPARLRRLQFGQEGAERRQFQLGQRLSADRLPGRAVPRQRRPGAVPVQPARRRRRACSATRSTPSSDLNQHAARRGRRSRRSPRASTRSRWPSACRPALRS